MKEIENDILINRADCIEVDFECINCFSLPKVACPLCNGRCFYRRILKKLE